MEPINIYSAPMGNGPNPWKTILVLAELDLPYKIIWISYGDIKSEPYLSLNPNGRLPSMVDNNTNVTLFESGAIIEYLVATYDKGLKLTYGEDKVQEKWLVHSWLMFQMSGQGPMFGQRMWFVHFQKDEKIIPAMERYAEEIKRILGVIEQHLKKKAASQNIESNATDKELWLVGDKCTFADFSFVFWDILLRTSLFPEGGIDVKEEFPNYHQWHERLLKRPAVRRVVTEREEAMERLKNEDTAIEVLRRQKQLREDLVFKDGIWKKA